PTHHTRPTLPITPTAHCTFRLPTPSQPSSLISFSTPPPPPDIYTLSLHDALPISGPRPFGAGAERRGLRSERSRYRLAALGRLRDRKSTRLNSSHVSISYAVFCLKKKK